MTVIDWNTCRQQLIAGLNSAARLQPDTARGYVKLDQVNTKMDVIDTKTRELIALAVAITLRCDGCIEVHMTEAKKAGATQEEFGEVLGVAIPLKSLRLLTLQGSRLCSRRRPASSLSGRLSVSAQDDVVECSPLVYSQSTEEEP
jgi:AhpD family alkylhydroperoxidase